MPSIAEVVVSAKPDGVGEVESEMNNLEKTTEETTENLDESAGRLGGLARKFKGAMLAIVGGLAIATAGVLSQVPVLGQAMDGLKAIFQGLAFQVDKKLRPFISKLSQEFFDLADAIFAGNYAKAKKEIGDILGLFTNINITQIIKDLQNLSANLISGIVGNLRQAMNNFSVGEIESVTGTLINLFKRSLRLLINAADWSAFILDIIEFMGKFGVGVGKAIKTGIIDPLISKIGTKFGEAVDAAKQWGKDIIDKIISGIENKASELKSAISGITIVEGITVGDVIEGDFDIGGGGGDGGTNNPYANGGFIGARGTGSGGVYIDGQRLDDNQGRYRKDVLNRRG